MDNEIKLKNDGQNAETVSKRRLKILIVAPALPLIGGQTFQAMRLAERLGAEDQLKVTHQPINPQLPGLLSKLQKIKYLRTIITLTLYIFALLIHIPFYDVIHIFSAGDSSFLLAPMPAVLIAKVFGKKTILNYRHGGAEEHIRVWKRTSLPIIRLFDKIVVPSGFLVDVFAKFELKATPIFNFINTDKYKFRERKPLRPIFLSNRNFDALYNISCIIRAFAIIQKRFPKAELIIAGDGEEQTKLKKLAKDLNLNKVNFLGRVQQEEMPKLFEKADIYVNSPNIDNMPSSVIEAFACGAPVVSTNVGGIPYIVENTETGLLVNGNDHEALANAAIKLLENDEIAQKIISKARLECEKYSWEKVRGEWIKCYQELV